MIVGNIALEYVLYNVLNYVNVIYPEIKIK